MSTRRQFLTQVGAASAAATLLPSVGCARKNKDKGAGASKPAVKDGRARVVLVTAAGAVGANKRARPEVVRRMLEQGLKSLAGTPDARAALARWVRPVDVVGLKVNCLAGRMMSTRVELVQQLVGLLAAAGLPRNNALVFDRSDRDLRAGGFQPRVGGKDYRCQSNENAGYERELQVMPSGASRFSTIATNKASVLINLPVLKDHGLAGVTAALKNNFGLVHNPNKFHLNGCDPHVAEVNARPVVQRKQRLIICDALRVQVQGGPGYHAAHAVTHDAMLLATDPVAMDMVAWGMLEGLRKERELKSLVADKRKPRAVLTAGKLGLGVADLSRIDIVRVKA